MEDLSIKFINKSLQICIMFLPIFIWDIYVLFQCFYPIPYTLYELITALCIVSLIFTILFGNSLIFIRYTKKEEIEIYFRKPNGIIILKNIYFGLPILFTLYMYAGIPFYIYALFQFLFMLFNKHHYTLTEKIYRMLADYYKKRRKNKTKEKETLLA